MSQLEEIKGRAEEAWEARSNYAGEDEGEGIMLAFLAEKSSYDIPKLIAALEAVEATLLQVDEISGGTSADGDAYGRGIDRGLQIAVVTVRKTLTEALQ